MVVVPGILGPKPFLGLPLPGMRATRVVPRVSTPGRLAEGTPKAATLGLDSGGLNTAVLSRPKSSISTAYSPLSSTGESVAVGSVICRQATNNQPEAV